MFVGVGLVWSSFTSFMAVTRLFRSFSRVFSVLDALAFDKL